MALLTTVDSKGAAPGMAHPACQRDFLPWRKNGNSKVSKRAIYGENKTSRNSSQRLTSRLATWLQ